MQSSIDPYIDCISETSEWYEAHCMCGGNMGFDIGYQHRSNYIFNILYGVWFMVYGYGSSNEFH